MGLDRDLLGHERGLGGRVAGAASPRGGASLADQIEKQVGLASLAASTIATDLNCLALVHVNLERWSDTHLRVGRRIQLAMPRARRIGRTPSANQ